ncbi:hypothetical protein [Halococcus salifodinae]|uniref:Uncharacterized protein n=1 Tax=Halococcus salifodinae DSM 8989 TaxID=1227456 RepID=M0NAR1_9EURY|nr:hypothetical protein [Halococcus salifodinae]EMA54658.1 hypothetical protein C450_05170 [Halococcus salifodinae DSM 8989]
MVSTIERHTTESPSIFSAFCVLTSPEPSYPSDEEWCVCRRLLVLDALRQHVHLLLDVLALNHLAALLFKSVLQDLHLSFKALGLLTPLDVVLHRF